MKKTPDITLDELLKELEPKVASTGLRTASELAKAWGCGIERVRGVLRRAADSGRLEIGRGNTASIDGRSCIAPAYRILPIKGKRK